MYVLRNAGVVEVEASNMGRKMRWAVFAGGEALDTRYTSYDAAWAAAEDARADAPDLEVDVDVAPEWWQQASAARDDEEEVS